MVNLRRATLSDRASIESVYAAAVGTSLQLSDDEWRRWVSLEGLVIAEENECVIGFGGIDITAKEQLRWLYLLPDFQRGGVGSKILKELEDIAWNSGSQSIRLHSTPGAVQFYSKRGYSCVPDQEQLGHDHDGVEMVKLR